MTIVMVTAMGMEIVVSGDMAAGRGVDACRGRLI